MNKPVSKGEALIGLWLKRSLIVIISVAVLIAVILLVIRQDGDTEEIIERDTIAAPSELNQETQARPVVTFDQSFSGIDFTHINGAEGKKYLPETMGSGVAFIDYDSDGDQDLLMVDGTYWPDSSKSGGLTRLFRNDGSGNFDDVTSQAGLKGDLYGMGAAVGDVDNDGDPDIFLSALGKNRFYRNQDGRFTDETDALGLAGSDDSWGSSAGFFDYDNDGDLDLFVCNYIQWSAELDIKFNFTLNGADRAYGPPQQYPGAHSYLYRNDGDTFTDVSEQAGIQVTNQATGAAMGKALALTFADLDSDGFLDVMIANDTVRNCVFKNLGDGRFEEVGVAAGLAFDARGTATGAMGMDAANYANDERLAVGIANFANESTSFYVQQPSDPWYFADMANIEGIGSPSRLKLSFGLFFFDYDLDGRQDMLQANGHLENEINEIQPSQFYRQPAQLFWNKGGGPSFAMVPEDESGELSKPIVGRGAAFGDLDGDGDLDVVLTDNGGKPLVLRNQQDLGHHWLRIKLEGTSSNRDGIGARATLTAGGSTQYQTMMPTRSYLSQTESVITFGLGKTDKVDTLTITWPNGAKQEVTVESVDTLLVIKQAG